KGRSSSGANVALWRCRATFRQGAPLMASQLNARHNVRVVIFLIAALLLVWASVDARAQGKGNATTTSTNGNSSWEQAIAALQAKVDQLTATVAQLQTALAAETSARENGDAGLQSTVNTQAAA